MRSIFISTNQAQIDIGGKKYISSRNASKLTGYTPDYIGQLARAGKISSQLVGKMRFVEEDALLAHKKGAHERDHSHLTYFSYSHEEAPLMPELNKGGISDRKPQQRPGTSVVPDGTKRRELRREELDIFYRTAKPQQRLVLTNHKKEHRWGALAGTTMALALGLFIFLQTFAGSMGKDLLGENIGMYEDSVAKLFEAEGLDRLAAIFDPSLSGSSLASVSESNAGFTGFFQRLLGGAKKFVNKVRLVFFQPDESLNRRVMDVEEELLQRAEQKLQDLSAKENVSGEVKGTSGPEKITYVEKVVERVEPVYVDSDESSDGLVGRVLGIEEDIASIFKRLSRENKLVDRDRLEKQVDANESSGNSKEEFNWIVIRDGEISGVEISAGTSTFSGTFTGATGVFNDSLTVRGDINALSDLVVSGNLTVTGAQTMTGVITVPYIVATSTTEASSIAYRLGIGTTSPAFALDVAGDINLTGDLKVNGTNAVFSNWTTSGSDIYRLSNVGIGTTSPWKALSVDGDLSLTGALFDSSASSGTPGHVLQSTGTGLSWVATSTLGFATDLSSFNTDDLSEGLANLYYTTARVNTDAPNVTLTGALDYLTISGQEITRNAIDLTTDVTGVLPDANIANNITLDNLTQITTRSHSSLQDLLADDHTQYALLVGRSGGQTLIGGTGTTDGLVLQTTSGAGTAGADMRFLVGNNGGTEALTILNNGNIGIGTTSPIAKLSVAGDTVVTGDLEVGTSAADSLTVNAGISSHLTPNSNAIFDLGSASFYWDEAFIDNITANTLSVATTTFSGTESANFTLNTGNSTTDTEDSSLIFFRGFVTPNAILRWNSTDDRFEFSQDLRIQDETPGTGVTGVIVKAGAGQGTNNLFTVSDASDNALSVFNASGHLGIGTSTPSSPLTVVGNGLFTGTLSASNLSGTNTGDVTLAGEDYLSLSGQQITAGAVDLATSNVTGILPLAGGGTGSATASGARTNLGLVIGTDVQAWGAVLDDLNTLGAASTDGEFVVATGAGAFAYESGNTARTSLGLGTGDSPTLTGLTLSSLANGFLKTNGSGVLATSTIDLTTDVTGVLPDANVANDIALDNLTQITTRSHSSLQDFLADDHTQYALLAGRSGGQTLIGGTASGNNLTLQSTSNATKGKILFGTSAYDEVNNRLGIGTASPNVPLEVRGTGDIIKVLADGGFAGFNFVSYRDSASTHGFFTGDCARGSVASPLVPNNGDQCFRSAARVWDGTNFNTNIGDYMVEVASAVSASTAAGKISFRANIGAGSGTPTEFLAINGGTGETVINDGGLDHDVRIESDTNTHALFVQGSDGRVGIGTASPQNDLHIEAVANPTLRIQEGSAGTSYSYFQHINDTSSRWANVAATGSSVLDIDSVPSDGTGIAAIRLFRTASTTGNAYLQFLHPDGAGLTSNALISARSGQNSYFAANGGNVGIGTASPAAKLHVFEGTPLGGSLGNSQILERISGSTGNVVMRNTWLYRDATGSDWTTTRVHDGLSVDTSFLTPGTDTKTWWERDPSNNIQSWGNAASTYLTINAGNVGIGQTEPSNLLEVMGASGNGIRIHANDAAVGATANLFFETRDGGASEPKSALIAEGTGGSFGLNKLHLAVDGTSDTSIVDVNDAKLTILSSGNVGIGTASPQKPFHVVATAYNTGIAVGENNATDILLIGYDNTNDVGVIQSFDGGVADHLALQTQGGNVGIGTTGPGEKFSVVSADNAAGTNIARFLAQNLSQSIGIGYQDVRQVAAGIPININAGTSGAVNIGNASSGGVRLAVGGGNVGIGTTSPQEDLHIEGSTPGLVLFDNDAEIHASINPAWRIRTTSIGGNLTFQTTGNYSNYSDAITFSDTGEAFVDALSLSSVPAVGSDALCWDGSGDSFIGDCSSSIQYKENLEDLSFGLETLKQLKPREFDWIDDGRHDLGFIAEEVAEVNPLLATFRDGEIRGVKYRHMAALLVQAIQELDEKFEEFAGVIKDGVLKVAKVVADKVTAKTVKTDGIEMVDHATGEVYCVRIYNGEWNKSKGDCTSSIQTGASTGQVIEYNGSTDTTEPIADTPEVVAGTTTTVVEEEPAQTATTTETTTETSTEPVEEKDVVETEPAVENETQASVEAPSGEEVPSEVVEEEPAEVVADEPQSAEPVTAEEL